jgi:putative nucleotidyltransferase with HDIG domain
MVKKQKKSADIKLHRYIKSSSFQRILAAIVTVLILSIVVSYEAAPKKYKLEVGTISQFDINAPRDIENKAMTLKNAEEKAAGLEPVILPIDNANTDIMNNAYEYFEGLISFMERVSAVTGEVPANMLIQQMDTEKEFAVLGQIPADKLELLLTSEGIIKVRQLKDILTKEILPELTQKDLMENNLTLERSAAMEKIRVRVGSEELSTIGNDVLKAVLKPNSRIDEAAMEEQRTLFIDAYIKENPVIIYQDERIISKDDVVTTDKFEVLKELNYIDSEGKPDYLLYASVFLLIFMLAAIAVLYLRNFHPKIYFDKNSVMLICISVLITTLFAWVCREFISDYAHLITPIFITPVILAIFLGIEPAITINLFLTFSFSLMMGGNIQFIIMSIVGGTIASYLTVNATQRRGISLAGVMLGGINALLVILTGILEKKSVESLLNDGGLAFVNGLLSVILAIGLLPFLESTFNVVTPMKLLELADPNHPLLKRLLMEAPGTYHHSLMVGNLAEVATREIGGNAILSRVGAYFHDVGKLKRPNFFKENQMAENPHDKLTPNLSTLVITSHTKDGVELGVKYRLPKIIQDMIAQHHGTTLVVYFYHKALQGEKSEEIKESSFRYEGPLPDTREAAIVMLADSIEAAVRAMPEKTTGKIEGLVRKIIKDKLDDGQLDRCDLTLKDLSIIADSFLTVLSGIFHERPEYPEFEKKNALLELDNKIYNITHDLKKEGGMTRNEANPIQQAEEGKAASGGTEAS